MRANSRAGNLAVGDRRQPAAETFLYRHPRISALSAASGHCGFAASPKEDLRYRASMHR
jgi:hypothetical protein